VHWPHTLPLATSEPRRFEGRDHVQIRNILVATDFSPDSERALETALELAKSSHATVHVVHGCLAFMRMPDDRNLPPEEWLETVRAEAQARLAAIEQRMSQLGVMSKMHFRQEDAVSSILAVAEAVSADLIVMGTRGLTGLKHVLLGSVAERTLRLAPCPVMTVKQPVK